MRMLYAILLFLSTLGVPSSSFANTLYGRVVDQTGTPRASFLVFRLNCPPSGLCPNNLLKTITVLLNTDGTVPIGVVVPNNDLITPAGSYYELDLYSATNQLVSYTYVLVHNCAPGMGGCPVFLDALTLYNPPNPTYSLYRWPTAIITNYLYNPAVSGSLGWKTFTLVTRPSISQGAKQ